MTTLNKQIIPKWINQSLQGITYWMGYRQISFPYRDLTEGVIAFALYEIIFANLKSNQIIHPEVQYSKLIKNRDRKEKIFGDRACADIVIYEKDESRGQLIVPTTVIEVKRYLGRMGRIEEDLHRLSYAQQNSYEPLRAFLFIASQHRRPKELMTEDDMSDRKIHRTKKNCVTYRVRRVCKALHSINKKDRAHYACLLEVVSK